MFKRAWKEVESVVSDGSWVEIWALSVQLRTCLVWDWELFCWPQAAKTRAEAVKRPAAVIFFKVMISSVFY